MKKFLFFLVVLIILGATCFFLGWAHLTVPPGSYGVIQSKTHGIDPEIIKDGEFRWLWYKLIPTNAQVSVFTVNPVRRTIRSSGSLSSGDVYTALAGIKADFTWEVSGELSFSLKPEYLPELVVREGIREDSELRKVEERLAERIESFTIQRLKAYADSEDEKKMESITITGSLPELETDIQRAFPEIQRLSCSIRAVRFPDYTLYQSVKALYREYISQQNAVLRPEVTGEAERRINTRIRLDELQKYGELLTQYPVLLEYLALEKELVRLGSPVSSPLER